MTISELANTLGISIDAVLVALYALLRADHRVAPMTILTPGVSASELDDTEQRLQYSLHRSHRTLLSLSNGGTLPLVNSLVIIATATTREREWRWLVAPEPDPRPTLDQGAGYGPFKPVLMGQPNAGSLSPVAVPRLALESFIVIATGYDSQFFGYTRTAPARIDVVADYGRAEIAVDFGSFLGKQKLTEECTTNAFLNRIRAFVPDGL